MIIGGTKWIVGRPSPGAGDDLDAPVRAVVAGGGVMTRKFWAIIGVGVAVISVVAGLFGRLDAHVRGQSERLARLEGKVDTLIAAFVKPGQGGA